jgi:hypothetical protein
MSKLGYKSGGESGKEGMVSSLVLIRLTECYVSVEMIEERRCSLSFSMSSVGAFSALKRES